MIGSGVNLIMTNETTTNEEVEGNETPTMTEEKWNELLKAVFHNGIVALKMSFSEVEGQVLNLEAYGPVFVYRVKDKANDDYYCGFFLREMAGRFQSGSSPEIWMASFFHELMKTKGGNSLPKPLPSEEEAKAVIDNVLVPLLIEAVREEFAPEQIHAGLAWNEEHGPVFEAGFPAITDGNNVCAIPLHLLLTHFQLNRDPSELLMQGLYKIREEHGME
jgi:hypothetical protein